MEYFGIGAPLNEFWTLKISEGTERMHHYAGIGTFLPAYWKHRIRSTLKGDNAQNFHAAFCAYIL